jgi:hypothetical protein
LEPWGENVYIDNYNLLSIPYFEKEKNNTTYDLSKRVLPYDNEKNNEILVEVDPISFNQEDFTNIQRFSQIIQHNGETGSFELGNLKINIIQMNEYQNTLINL